MGFPYLKPRFHGLDLALADLALPTSALFGQKVFSTKGY